MGGIPHRLQLRWGSAAPRAEGSAASAARQRLRATQAAGSAAGAASSRVWASSLPKPAPEARNPLSCSRGPRTGRPGSRSPLPMRGTF